jgi:hypothetical protein
MALCRSFPKEALPSYDQADVTQSTSVSFSQRKLGFSSSKSAKFRLHGFGEQKVGVGLKYRPPRLFHLNS